MKRQSVLVALCLLAANGFARQHDWQMLFDQTSPSLDGWKMSGPGAFVMASDGTIKSTGGMGLFYYAEAQFEDFELEVEWRVEQRSANSGVFVRFPDGTDPWAAVEGGYEIQIDETSDGNRHTGAVYSFAAPSARASNAVGEWNRFNIRAHGQLYQVRLNGQLVTEFVGSRATRGHIGLQNHDDNSVVWIRQVRIRPLAVEGPTLTQLANAMRTDDAETIRVLTVTATHGFRHQAAIDKLKALIPELNRATEFEFDVTENVADLNTANLAEYDVLFLANATLRVDEPTEDAVTDPNELVFEPGNWRNFSAKIHTPERDIPGRIALSGTPDNLSGLVDFGTGISRIEDVTLTGKRLTMQWYARADIGAVRTELNLSDEGFEGLLHIADQSIQVSGTVADIAAQQEWEVANPVTADHRAAISEFVNNGGGLAVAHAGLDALYGWGEYRRMVGGGLFESHPWTQIVTVNVEDPHHAATLHLGDALELRDEIYVLDRNPRWQSHVLASLDLASVGIAQGPADATRSDFPISWVRRHGAGRVFATKLGHFPDVWTNASFLRHLLQGMRVAAGRIEANFGGRRIKDVIADDVWPDDIAIDTEGNVWIAELRGKIHRYDAVTGTTQFVTTLPTTDPTKIEHGLLGIEVDPAFHSGENYIYLYYTEPETFINTLIKVPVVDAHLQLDNAQTLLRVPTDPMCCHQAGDLEWALDGTLYLSTGDTGMSETRPEWELTDRAIKNFEQRNDLKSHHWSRLVDSERSAQNLQDLRGKVLRINKDGTIPHDNPFFGRPGVRWEIYAYGLRNPYRFKVHPATGDLIIGVVGPDARFDYDEYNLATRGGENFGWPRSIGRLFYNNWTPQDIDGFTPPLWEYTYAGGGRSATVGPVYSTRAANGFPAFFSDRVFVYDWARRWIKTARLSAGTFTSDKEADVRRTPLEVNLPTQRLTDIRDFDQLTVTAPISMALGPDGAVYVAEFDGFWDAGPNAKVTRYRWTTDASDPGAHDRSAAATGEYLYNTRCASCHQADGAGVAGVFPPLTNNPRIASDDGVYLTKVVLDGISGPLEVDGIAYSGSMPPWRAALDDNEIAKLANYVLARFIGAEASVDPRSVAEQR